MPTRAVIEHAIAREGLAARGLVRLEEAERVGRLAKFRSLALVGMAGSGAWAAFASAPEAEDGAPDPLDRWSRRVIDAIALELAGEALYPFEGPPYWPFQAWARRVQGVWPSPLGILIDRDYGLWHGFRGALAFREEIEAAQIEDTAAPCEACAGRPCMSGCPVGAFTSRGFDAARCASFLREPSGSVCRDGGCLARRACPVGSAHAYGEAQMRFYMRAFLKARPVNP